jgi:hypothetical protein
MAAAATAALSQNGIAGSRRGRRNEPAGADGGGGGGAVAASAGAGWAALAGDRGDHRRGVGRVRQSAAQGGNLHREIVLLDDRAAPDLRHDLVLGQDAVTVGHQHGQDIEGAGADGDRLTGAAQKSALEVQPERSELDDVAGPAHACPRQRTTGAIIDRWAGCAIPRIQNFS